MNYIKGNRVRHPGMMEWGVGLVLEDSQEFKARIFFEEVGEKTVSLKHVEPVLLSGAAAESLVLDNLKIEKGSVGVRYKSLNASMDYFLQKFPGGFRGERFRQNERDYKEDIRDQFKNKMNREAMRAMLSAGAYREICALAVKLTGARKNAMIFSHEKMDFRDGLASPDAAKTFSEALFGLLHEADDFEAHFNGFIGCLQDIKADNWTLATYFLFFMHPDRHMFIKPTITQNAADVCAFEINYRPELNLQTYRSVLDFSAYLFEAIKALEPRDMIDVQSFMWCIRRATTV
jgi:hypothetical protein